MTNFAEPANDNEPAINSRDLAVLDTGHQPVNIDAYFERTGTKDGWTGGRPRRGKPRTIINPDGNAERRRIAERDAIGRKKDGRFIWDGRTPANDNLSLPVLKALQDERESAPDRERMARAVMDYRRLQATAENPNPTRPAAVDDRSLEREQRTWFDNGNLFKAPQPGALVHAGSGAVEYKGIRVVDRNEPIPGRRAIRADLSDGEQKGGGFSKVATKWEGDAPLLAKIDAVPILARVRSALGPLLQPVEDAVLYAMSLTTIGENEGATNGSTAAGIGKGLVYRGLRVIAGVLDEVALSKSARRAV